VGYLNRRPYLWFVGLEDRVIEPAAELRDIPQGINEVVPLESAVAVRCGPTWFALEPDLSGQGRALDRSELAAAERESVQVKWPVPPSVYDRELVLPASKSRSHVVSHPAVAHWSEFSATWGPDRRTIAVEGSATPFRPYVGPLFEEPYRPGPRVLALIDSVEGIVRVCDGTFENFCYPPAWSANGEIVTLGAPFEPKRLYKVRPEIGVLEVVLFKRHAPSPLIDSARLSTGKPESTDRHRSADEKG